MAEALLSLRGVKTDIGRYHILHGVEFDVAEGGLTMLLGRNGAGKTTLLKILSRVTQLLGARRHSLTKRQRKAGERAFGHPKRLQTRVTDRHTGPCRQLFGPVCCGRDMRREPSQEIAATRGVVDVKHCVNADIRFRPRAQDQRLNVVQLQRHAVRAEAVLEVLEDTHQ